MDISEQLSYIHRLPVSQACIRQILNSVGIFNQDQSTKLEQVEKKVNSKKRKVVNSESSITI